MCLLLSYCKNNEEHINPASVKTKDNSDQVKIQTRASSLIFTQQLINHIY